MKKRHIAGRLLAALRDTPAVYVRGPRQSGKTTLVRSLSALGHKAEYFTLDDAATLAAAQSDPHGFVAGLPERVIIDEVQHVPELFRAIKKSVDENRRPGRFLLTGSTHVLGLPKASESLAGRMEPLTLWPFTQSEIAGRVDTFVGACFARSFKPADHAGADASWKSVAGRIAAGGYPEVLSRKSAERRGAWFGAHLTTVLDRDVRDIANVAGLRELPRLLRLAAARAAGLLNVADLARDAAMPQTTVQRYWSLLEAAFLVRTIPPWHANLGMRLVKTPKVLLTDTGLLCHLLGLDADRLRRDDLMAGAALECFVANELTRQIEWSNTRPSMHHFRTHAQHKVDLILEDRAGRLVGIEVKKTAGPDERDFKGLRRLADETGKRFLRGILLYCGDAGVAFSDKILAVPVSALWK